MTPDTNNIVVQAIANPKRAEQDRLRAGGEKPGCGFEFMEVLDRGWIHRGGFPATSPHVPKAAGLAHREINFFSREPF